MNKGRVLEVTFEDVFYNLALEESIFTNLPKFNLPVTIRFWQNPKSVILGRGQNLREEIDETYCVLNGIKICRRISGGGAVYHDKGNLNISFFIKRSFFPDLNETEQYQNYFTNTIIEALRKHGINDVEKEGISNILYQKKKISGAAGYLKKEWFLHHTTLLFAANLEHLENSLLSRTRDSPDKKVSRYYPTTNLKINNLPAFKRQLIRNLSSKLNIRFEQSFLSNSEKVLADKLKTNVYNQPDWVFKKRRDI